VITDSWPGQMRTVFGDHERFEQTYFSTFPALLHRRRCPSRRGRLLLDHRPGGRCTQRLRHRMGTAEIESALVAHPKVAEAAVVGVPHEIKGQGIYAYVTLIAGEEPSRELHKEVKEWVRKEIGAIATPDVIHWAEGCPRPVPARSCGESAQDRHRRNRQPGGYLHPGGSGVVDKLIREKSEAA
jgi:acetyl-CoA synthetase